MAKAAKKHSTKTAKNKQKAPKTKNAKVSKRVKVAKKVNKIQNVAKMDRKQQEKTVSKLNKLIADQIAADASDNEDSEETPLLEKETNNDEEIDREAFKALVRKELRKKEKEEEKKAAHKQQLVAQRMLNKMVEAHAKRKQTPKQRKVEKEDTPQQVEEEKAIITKASEEPTAKKRRLSVDPESEEEPIDSSSDSEETETAKTQTKKKKSKPKKGEQFDEFGGRDFEEDLISDEDSEKQNNEMTVVRPGVGSVAVATTSTNPFSVLPNAKKVKERQLTAKQLRRKRSAQAKAAAYAERTETRVVKDLKSQILKIEKTDRKQKRKREIVV